MKREREKNCFIFNIIPNIPFLHSFLLQSYNFSLFFFIFIFLLLLSMKNTLRCCISCILPCGSLDVIRIIHANGRVEEINRTVRASQIMEAYPNHVLKKPSSPSDDQNSSAPKIVIVSPEADLQRGKIYFLMPSPAPTSKKTVVRSETRRKREKTNNNNNQDVVMSDRYLSEILSEKIISSNGKDRRRGRAGVWRPHLDSISETMTTSITEVL